MNVVIDSSAIIAFLQQEPGALVVRDTLLRDTCYMHAINLCEVYYDALRAQGEAVAKSVVADILSTGIRVREDMDTDLWQAAGTYKAVMRRVSLADCFCIALAGRLDGDLLTADRHELGVLAQSGTCKITFIR